jgi:hypothetical protein
MLSRNTLKGMSDDKLIASLKTLVAKQSQLTAELLCHIAEVESRKLYLAAAYGSMFKLCVEGLGLSESMAYKHIAVARAARKHEAILTMVKDGRLHLSAVLVLVPYLTADNCAELLEAAAGQSKRQVERLIAQRFPKADVPTQVRKLPQPSPPQGPPCQGDDSQLKLLDEPIVAGAAEGGSDHGDAKIPAQADSSQPAEQVSPQQGQDGASLTSLTVWGPGAHSRTTSATGTGSSCTDGARRNTGPAAAAEPAREQRPRIEPLAAARYKVQFTASEQLVGKLRQAQELLRRQVPDGDPAVICERALDLLIESLLKKRFALPSRKTAAPAGGGASRPVSTPEAARRPVLGSTATTEPDAVDQQEGNGTGQTGSASGTVRRPRSRYIPAAVRRQVAERDGLQCTYVGPDGKRCERRDVEFHHLTPFARGGQHRVEEITLRCRGHNVFQAELDYGEEHIAWRIRQQRALGRRRRAERDRAARDGVDGAPGAAGTVQAAEGG